MDFESHLKNDHNMWKYVWYMIYLQEKVYCTADIIIVRPFMNAV